MMFVVLEDKSPRGRGNAMNKFIEKLGKQVEGVLAGFDRLVFRGTLRRIVYDAGMKSYLWQNQVLLKDFGKHVERTSQQLKAASLTAAQQAGRPVRYLPSSQVSKEQIAREIAAKDQVRQGTVCVLTSVEPCWSFEVGPNRETKQLELTGKPRKCLFLYHYWMHPEFGFMNARIQTWFPFSIQICLNGEGKPSLDACVHESELRVHPVVIKEQALARFAGQFQLLGFPVGPHLEAPAGFHARQHAHRALPHLILSRDLPCDLFLTHLAGWQIPHRSPRLLRRSQRSRL